MWRALVTVTLLLTGCAGSRTQDARSTPGLPTVRGSYGSTPTLTFPGGPVPRVVASTVRHVGNGAVVRSGQLLVVDYVGHVWGAAKPFDSSFARRTPAAFVLGKGQVVPGWDNLLAGKRLGSQVVMTLPPSFGYGQAGNPDFGIRGTDTLAFAVDLVGAYGAAAGGDPHATVESPPPAGIGVGGARGSIPSVTVGRQVRPPAAATVTVLARSSGQPVKAGVLVLQYVAVSYSGTVVGSTWKEGSPAAIPLAGSGAPGLYDGLLGIPLGSRVLLQVPAAGGRAATVVVADLVAQPG